MKVAAILQARLDSTRLPGKVLSRLGDEPLLHFLVKRYRNLCSLPLVIATTYRDVDQPIVNSAKSLGVDLQLGDLHDVGQRFQNAIDRWNLDIVVRITADNPFAAFEEIPRFIQVFLDSKSDYVSNKIGFGYPVGSDVEVFDAKSFLNSRDEQITSYEQEHVTPRLYRGGDFIATGISRTIDVLSRQRLTIDTPQDLKRGEALVRTVRNPAEQPWAEFASAASEMSPNYSLW